MPKTQVAISFLGTVLDNGFGQARWQKWRPNIALHQRADIGFNRMELFYSEKYCPLAERVRDDIHALRPNTQVNLINMELANPWDFSEVYTKLHDWAASYPFDTEAENYYTHITTARTLPKFACFCWWKAAKSPACCCKPRRRKTKSAAWRKAMWAAWM